jgi:rRNA maturation endonuclease Nob1
MIIALAIALTLAVLTLVLFVREKDLPAPEPVSPIQHLEDRKQAIYENLRDLQFEYRVGKLSDEDYQGTKQALQRELAGVLAEIETTIARLNLVFSKNTPKKPGTVKKAGSICPFCGAEFPQALKFCGECGKAIA